MNVRIGDKADRSQGMAQYQATLRQGIFARDGVARMLFAFLFRTDCKPPEFAPWADTAPDGPREQR
ncbi:hypothetical protein GO001_17445 [Streptomyces sp. NRRL B-1677]|uniref:hypothetical protein n=1 Tax=Streptomyces TaxID=1883 RepID=UPI001892C581|nr:hypothetical protein [Streptomyces sp. NRRL B-1677]MBF6047001.1 hypothetical protein [Streptomyces sp. NRRL B-1677]